MPLHENTSYYVDICSSALKKFFTNILDSEAEFSARVLEIGFPHDDLEQMKSQGFNTFGNEIGQATKYIVTTLLHGERGEHLIHGFKRAWIRHFGLPQCLCTDEGRGWVGDEMNECMDHPIRCGTHCYPC